MAPRLLHADASPPDRSAHFPPANARGIHVATAEQTIPFGTYGDIPLVGDWTGTGTDSIGTYRPTTTARTPSSPIIRFPSRKSP